MVRFDFFFLKSFLANLLDFQNCSCRVQAKSEGFNSCLVIAIKLMLGNIVSLRFTVRVSGLWHSGVRRGWLCIERTRRGTAWGQEMVGSKMRRGTDVVKSVGSPPSRRDHGIPLSRGMWNGRSVSQGSGGSGVSQPRGSRLGLRRRLGLLGSWLPSVSLASLRSTSSNKGLK